MKSRQTIGLLLLARKNTVISYCFVLLFLMVQINTLSLLNTQSLMTLENETSIEVLSNNDDKNSGDYFLHHTAFIQLFLNSVVTVALKSELKFSIQYNESYHSRAPPS